LKKTNKKIFFKNVFKKFISEVISYLVLDDAVSKALEQNPKKEDYNNNQKVQKTKKQKQKQKKKKNQMKMMLKKKNLIGYFQMN
jgi:FtsZ-interacting cell division protein YlmF